MTWRLPSRTVPQQLENSQSRHYFSYQSGWVLARHSLSGRLFAVVAVCLRVAVVAGIRWPVAGFGTGLLSIFFVISTINRLAS